MDVAVRTVSLRKTYLGREGHDAWPCSGLTMTVPRGGVHGFLGPNGSGKTTTIRMLLGLIRADSGTAELFGERGARGGSRRSSTGSARSSSRRSSSPPSPAGRTSCSSPTPSARRGTRVDEVLEATQLGRPRPRPVCRLLPRHEAAPRHRRDPAQGPRPAHLRRADQRARPGRHPRGARHDARRSARRARRCSSARTSSAEVEQVADTVSIIGHGRLLAPGPSSEILGGRPRPQVRVGVADPDAAEQVLRDGGLARDPRRRAAARRGAEDPAESHAGPGRPRALRQRADAGARRPRVGVPVAHRADEPRGGPSRHDGRKEVRHEQDVGPRRLRRLLRRRLTLFVVLGVLLRPAAGAPTGLLTGPAACPTASASGSTADYEPGAAQDFAQNGRAAPAASDCRRQQAERARATPPPTSAATCRRRRWRTSSSRPLAGAGSGRADRVRRAAGPRRAVSRGREVHRRRVQRPARSATWLDLQAATARVSRQQALAAGGRRSPLGGADPGHVLGARWRWSPTLRRTPAPPALGHIAAVGAARRRPRRGGGVGGAALGMLLRHTAGLLGLLLGYAVVVEGIRGNNVRRRAQPVARSAPT